MKLVELIRGQATSDESMTRRVGSVRRAGKTAIEAADYPGFIANRILMPMINEAIFAVMEGVGTPEAIDTVMKLRDEPSDGSARARRLHRAGRLPGDPERHARRPRRSEVPPVSAPPTHGGCRASRQEIGPRILRLRLSSLDGYRLRPGASDRRAATARRSQIGPSAVLSHSSQR